MIRIAGESPKHRAAIERLLDEGFGAGRFERPSYRFRAGVAPVAALCRIALENGEPVGVIRFWPITIGARTPALLLGPIAVAASHRQRGLGSRLMRAGLAACRRQRHALVVAIGDLGFLGRFGFVPARGRGLALAAPVADDRFLVLALNKNALRGVGGEIGPARGGD